MIFVYRMIPLSKHLTVYYLDSILQIIILLDEHLIRCGARVGGTMDYIPNPRGRRILRSGHFKRFIYSPRWLVCFYVGYRAGNSTPELPWQLSYVELVQKHKLNFLLKNYISKTIFQHIIGMGRSRGAFYYSFCSSGTSVTWEKVAKRGHFS
jgi:hypothetical protein